MERFFTILLFLLSFPILQAQELVPVLNKENNKYGYKEKGKFDWSIPPKYDKAKSFSSNIAVVGMDGKEYLINLHGNKISGDFKEITRAISQANLPFIAQNMDGTFGLYDLQAKAICGNAKYEYMAFNQACDNTVVIFAVDNRYGIMDIGGNILVPATYSSLKPDNYYYGIGYKRCDKDHISQSDLAEIFFEAKDSMGKYGVITVNNEVMVPFTYKDAYKLKYKGTKANYTKTIKNYVLNRKSETKKLLDEAYLQMSQRNEELAKAYPTTLPKITRTVIKKTKQGYAFFKGKKQVSKNYQKIDEYKDFCIVKRNKKIGLSDPLGSEIVECKYDDINVWNANENILVAENRGKYVLINASGEMLTEKPWDILFFPENEVAVGVRNGLYWLLDGKGKIISSCGYNNIDNYSNSDKIMGYRMGRSTEISRQGKEVSPIAEQIFNEAYNMQTGSNAQAKYDRYMLCISCDPDNKLGYRSLSLNNIGAMFEDLGDTNKAIEFYEQAKSLGNDTARKNIKRIRLNNTLNTLQKIGETLTQVGQTIDTSGSYGNIQPNGTYDYSSGGSGLSSSSQNGSKQSYEYWKQMYDRWERNAKGCYESLTLNGYKKKTNGKDSGGGAAGTWNSSAYTGMKMNLRKAQKEMRETRALARKDGHNIPQSNYETINVSY